MIDLNYNNKLWNIRHIVLLLVLTIICFWPLAFGVFSAKNDNIIQFLPTRFHVSEALRHGHLPLWTPYMYLGYPLHGDMQGGAWNPFVWFVSIFGRYNIVSLHSEILFYIFMSGIGMYRLLGAIKLSPVLRIIGASAYLMSGYITDVAGSNIPFLAAAAYIPFVFAYYYHLLTTPAWKYSLKTAFFLTLLFVTGYPSFFICTCYILFTALILVIIRNKFRRVPLNFTKLIVTQALMATTFFALSAPAIISYWQILPFYQRGTGVSLSAALENSFHPYCSLSFLLPPAQVKLASTAVTDLISKNAYFNSALLVSLLCYPWAKKTFFRNFTLAGIIFFFLFSLGSYTPLREWCYQLLPLMNTFRHPSNARLFVIIGAIVLGTVVLEKYAERALAPRYPAFISVTLLSFIVVMLALSLNHVSIPDKLADLFQTRSGNRLALKHFFDSLNYYDLLVFSGVIQIIVLGLFYFLLRKTTDGRNLIVLLIVNSFVFAQLSIPYTLVSKVSPGTINRLITGFPSGFPIPDPTKTIEANSQDALVHLDEIGIESFYNKKIATVDLVFTPTFMTQMERLMTDDSRKHYMLSHPYAFFDTTQKASSFQLLRLWNNGFEFVTSTNTEQIFYLQQLYLPGWRGFIDGKRTNLLKANSAFIAIKIPAGTHRIKFTYMPGGIIVCFIISIFSVLTLIFLLAKNRFGAVKKQ